MKLCKDCANFRRGDATCAASPKDIDMVTGVPGRYYYAITERQGHLRGDCGPHAIKFVAKSEVVYPTHEVSHAAQ